MLRTIHMLTTNGRRAHWRLLVARPSCRLGRHLFISRADRNFDSFMSPAVEVCVCECGLDAGSCEAGKIKINTTNRMRARYGRAGNVNHLWSGSRGMGVVDRVQHTRTTRVSNKMKYTHMWNGHLYPFRGGRVAAGQVNGK